MYPTRNYLINNGYSTLNNQQQTGSANANSTGFFPRSMSHQNVQHQPISYISANQYQLSVNSFDFRQQPPFIMNSQSSVYSLPPPPPPPSLNQLQLQGLFQAPPFLTNRQQLTTSNFADRNVIFSSVYSAQSSQNHVVNPLTKVTLSSIPNSHNQPILPSPLILPTSSQNTRLSSKSNVPISDELHISASNLSEGIYEDHNNPLGKRTVINEQALAKLAKKNQQNYQAMEAKGKIQQNGVDPNLAGTTNESSPESVKFGGESEEDEEMENPEMAKNWRILMLFNGRIQDSDLFPNCERPQNAKGIEFPYPESLSKWKFLNSRQQLENMDLDEELYEDEELSPMEGTSQQNNGRKNDQISSRAKSLPPPPMPPPILNQNERGYVLPNGRTWVRHRPPAPLAETAQQEGAKSLAAPSKSKILLPPSPRNHIQKRFANNTLLIMKNGTRLQGGTNVCYQFAETGNCQTGIFCKYEHNGSMEHTKKWVCNRLLRGLCPETGDNCPGGPHSPLLPHQLPICDFYLRLVCRKGKEKCPFLHVRHTPGTQPCADFNNGKCQRGIMCDAPHRYYYYQIKQKSSDPKQQHINRNKTTNQAQQSGTTNSQELQQNIRLYLNTETTETNSTTNLEKPPSPPLKWIE